MNRRSKLGKPTKEFIIKRRGFWRHIGIRKDDRAAVVNREKRRPSILKDAVSTGLKANVAVSIAYLATTFTSFCFTMITRRTGRSPTNLLTSGLLSAAARISSSLASAETVMEPRSLPFTWQTRVSSSALMASSETSGHFASMRSPSIAMKPSSFQSAVVMWSTELSDFPEQVNQL